MASRTMTFQDARDLVAGDPDVRDYYPDEDFQVAEYGWQDSDKFLVVAGTRKDVTGLGDGAMTLDPPCIFVDKSNGSVDLQFGLQALTDPTYGMKPVGSR